MADQTKNTHERPQKANEYPHTIPAEPFGAGAHPTVSPGCNANPSTKKRTVTPADIAEATQTML